ncbi:GNAT family N-acetyltransferase [Arthrobacter sp. NPDC057009]|uniref:GNAT family N-acetyltransferase n=1 Tax=Arthrobacter sp. NPDC057009 TaxID=3345996 RepID=UPI003645595F
MIYAQHGIERFLTVPFHYPNCNTDKVLLAKSWNHEILGFADFRLHEDNSAFLSYICVAEEARGRGIATGLISSFLEENPHVTHLGLDVFDDNTAAKALYEKLGFETQSASAWITRPIPEPHGAVSIASLPAAVSAFEAHGFCELDVRRGIERLNMGRIGEEVLRCPSAASFDDDGLLSAVRSAFPELKEAFAIIPVSEVPAVTSKHEIATVSNRMRLIIDLNGN